MCLKKLGRHRCKVVWCRDGGNSGPKDANDTLQLLRSLQMEHTTQIGEMERRLLGIKESRSAESEEYRMAEMEMESMKRRFQEEERKYDISTILSKAQIVPHDHILRFEDIRREIQEQLTSYNSISGMSFGSALPTLTKILKVQHTETLDARKGRIIDFEDECWKRDRFVLCDVRSISTCRAIGRESSLYSRAGQDR